MVGRLFSGRTLRRPPMIMLCNGESISLGKIDRFCHLAETV
jgi:hypothetical protein